MGYDLTKFMRPNFYDGLWTVFLDFSWTRVGVLITDNDCTFKVIISNFDLTKVGNIGTYCFANQRGKYLLKCFLTIDWNAYDWLILVLQSLQLCASLGRVLDLEQGFRLISVQQDLLGFSPSCTGWWWHAPQAPFRRSFLHSHGFSGFDEAHSPTRAARASFSHCNHSYTKNPSIYIFPNKRITRPCQTHRCRLRPVVVGSVMPCKPSLQHLLLWEQSRINNHDKFSTVNSNLCCYSPEQKCHCNGHIWHTGHIDHHHRRKPWASSPVLASPAPPWPPSHMALRSQVHQVPC